MGSGWYLEIGATFGMNLILAIFMLAVAFLNTFSATGKSISRLERHRECNYIM